MQQQWSRPKFMQIILSFLWEYNEDFEIHELDHEIDSNER